MKDQWSQTSILKNKVEQFSEALNVIMKLLLEQEKKKIDNVKKTLEVVGKKKNG